MDSEGFKIPPVPEKSHHSPNSKQDTPMDSDSIGRKRLFEEEEEKQESKRRKVETSDSHGTTIAHDPLKDDRTVFISNLSYDSDDESIKDFFSKMGELEEVRLVRDYKGRSKGYCYVVYKSQESVKQALAKDRELLDGRPVLISPCEDRKNKNLSQSKFKFGTGLERKKLFVKGLPFTTTKEDLKTMFEEHGPLKDIRIVTYRNGHSKGLAYIEYEDETSAGNAVVKLDGTQIKDNVISVAISNPPPRKPKREFSNAPSSVSLSSSLGSGSGASKGPRGRGRTQLSLLPRSVMRPAATANASNGSIQNGKNSDAQEKQKPLSNSDFSKMLRK
ncbi:squamous cell carcinoma antigen recognized by T-cells 3 [Caerostris extrusa]|uniref:Squamous cell carcinoma antigen recognized by T-cells 3 n=1 Tax=Caerostris extrusa TaxID=172846 RepID=A0AAV4QLG1_CAEEX|nr:squamous cell carcinoma antigen recognized by T-cells 3 [Caerostris extrusa]